MHIYKYEDNVGIHCIAYSGRINKNEGMRRIQLMERIFIHFRNTGKVLRILMDTRGYIKENPEIHDELAKISREKFDKELSSVNKFTAILNDHYVFKKSDNEYWFTGKQNALSWLLFQK